MSPEPRKLNQWEKIIKLEDFFLENKDKEFFQEFCLIRRTFWRGLLTEFEYYDRMQEVLSSFLRKEMEKNFGIVIQALKDTE